MKVCPQCEEQYPEDVEFCAKDGAKLRRATDDETDPMLGRVLDGRYRIEQRFSEGGMGAIYLAKQETVGREVAIKTLRTALADDEEFTERFMREAKVTSRISHPNCVTIHDFGQTDDTLLYLVMEYLEGETLADRLDRGALSQDEAISIAIQVANALEAAHDQDVVHRDLKPDNIFLLDAAGERGFVKVLDFGISKVVDDSDENLTQTGQVFGTPEYMSPEQGRSKPLDGRSDLYSLGCILYEALAGEPPFREDTPMATLVSHIQQEPRPIDELVDVPDDLAALVSELLEKDADDRPASAQVVRERLEAVRAGGSVSRGSTASESQSRSNDGGGDDESASPIDSQWGENADSAGSKTGGMPTWVAVVLFAMFAVVLLGGAGVVAWYAYDTYAGDSVATADTGVSTEDATDRKFAAADEDESNVDAAGGEWLEETAQAVLGGQKKQQGSGADTPTSSGETDGESQSSGSAPESHRKDSDADKGARPGDESTAEGASAQKQQNGSEPPTGAAEPQATGEAPSDEVVEETGGADPPQQVGDIPNPYDDPEDEATDKSAEPPDDETNKKTDDKASGSDDSSAPSQAPGDETSSQAEATPEPTDDGASAPDESEEKPTEPAGPTAADYVAAIRPSPNGPFCRSQSVRQTLKDASMTFGKCARDAGGTNGVMVFQFLVTSSGEVLNTENFSTDINSAISSCVLEKTKTLPFGQQAGGNCPVRVTLELKKP